MKELADAAERAETEARAAVVYGHGGHFSAGLDLSELVEWAGDPLARNEHLRTKRAQRPFDEIARSSIPFVAAVTGACVGGGLEIAAACHLRVADPTAFFALPEGQRGIYLGGGGSVRVSRLIGVPLMSDLMLTGRVLSAEDGERRGLINYIAPQGEGVKKAEQLATRIAENGEAVNWAVVAGLPRINDAPYDEGFFTESLVLESVLGRSSGSTERLKEFLAKKARPLARPDTAEGR
jgi:enoyl-CoA hydratase/carnithine racemase